MPTLKPHHGRRNLVRHPTDREPSYLPSPPSGRGKGNKKGVGPFFQGSRLNASEQVGPWSRVHGIPRLPEGGATQVTNSDFDSHRAPANPIS
jgi:hypothetical protein